MEQLKEEEDELICCMCCELLKCDMFSQNCVLCMNSMCMNCDDDERKFRGENICEKCEEENTRTEEEEEAKEKKFKSTYTNIISWDILKPLGITKKIPKEWRKGLVKDKNGLVAEIEDVKAKKKGFIRTKFVFTLEKKDGDKKEFEIKIEYELDSKIAAIIEDELEYDITDDEEEQNFDIS